MSHVKNFKEFCRSYKKLFQLNVTALECPSCNVVGTYPSAKFGCIKDEKYHKLKYYICCRFCKQITPAFEDPKEALENWSDLFILKEDEILLKDEV